MKIHNSRELHKVAINDSSDINFDKFNSLYRKYTSEPFHFYSLILFFYQIIKYVLKSV